MDSLNLIRYIFYFCSLTCVLAFDKGSKYNFSKTFKFGVATSAYQIEGGWNANKKGQNIWDYQTHTFPDKISDRSNGDIACDSYNKIDEDIKNLKMLKVDFYRFSISWSRMLPTGFTNVVNADGVRYYTNLINKLRENDIEPVVTIFHWDLPQSLQDLGGWANSKIVDYFSDFANICFKTFGDKVKTWITMNEPVSICVGGYGFGKVAPFLYSDGIGTYLCGHNLILAHAKVYRLYKEKFYETQKGRIGITIDTPWWEPKDDNSKNAAVTMIQMYFGWYAHPIFSQEGDYPNVMRQRIDDYSRKQNFTSSRLPYFTKDEIDMVKGSSDFLGLNHYTTFYVIDNFANDIFDILSPNIPSSFNDIGVIVFSSPLWEHTAVFTNKVVPWGFRKLLQWIKREYNNPEVLITENGYGGGSDENLTDTARIRYYNEYLTELLKAINEDNCTVLGYTAWSLMDNFEWSSGYSIKFGLFHVNFNDHKRPRTARQSAFMYRNIIESKQINDYY